MGFHSIGQQNRQPWGGMNVFVWLFAYYSKVSRNLINFICASFNVQSKSGSMCFS